MHNAKIIKRCKVKINDERYSVDLCIECIDNIRIICFEFRNIIWLSTLIVYDDENKSSNRVFTPKDGKGLHITNIFTDEVLGSAIQLSVNTHTSFLDWLYDKHTNDCIMGVYL